MIQVAIQWGYRMGMGDRVGKQSLGQSFITYRQLHTMTKYIELGRARRKGLQ